MPSSESYIVGIAAVVTALAVVTWGATRLRAALVPHFAGAPARLVDAVLLVGAVLAVGQLMGATGLLRPWTTFTALVVVGVAMAAAAARIHVSPRSPSMPAATPRTAEVVIAVAAMALTAAQWSMHTAFALGRGMTHPDTLWYHGPFSVRFVQTASFGGLESLGYAASRYYPFNSELVHALALLPYHRDSLSPFVNLAWLALALLAAWCVGVRANVAPLSALAACVVCSLPMVVGTQPGQASTDIPCAALLLSSIALLLLSDRDAVVVGIAGIAAGLAIGTKLNTLPLVAVLSVFVLVLATVVRRPRLAASWFAGLVAFGSWWYLRDWVTTGSPLPWFNVPLLHARVGGSVRELGVTLLTSLRRGDYAWRFYRGGLTQAMGRGWPIVLVVVIVSVVASVVAGAVAMARTRVFVRAAGVAALAGIVAYTVTPLTGGLSFGFNLRYLTPTFMVAFVIVPLGLRTLAGPARVVMTVLLVVSLLGAATAANHELVPAWPARYWWVGLLGAVVIVVGAALRARRPPMLRPYLVLLAAAAVVFLLPIQRHFLEHRYVDAKLTLDPVNRYFSNVRNARVAVYGTVEVYPMFGRALSNQVVEPVGPVNVGDPCRVFERVRRGDYDYVVLTSVGLVSVYEPPRTWFRRSPTARVVYRDGRSVVYRITGGLQHTGCVTGSRSSTTGT
ncbi:MAG: hypothetical protein QOI55_1358 [Actinomycetota bacterium]|nr:hypothetical protein [Actinomycetota bacterium]